MERVTKMIWQLLSKVKPGTVINAPNGRIGVKTLQASMEFPGTPTVGVLMDDGEVLFFSFDIEVQTIGNLSEIVEMAGGVD